MLCLHLKAIDILKINSRIESLPPFKDKEPVLRNLLYN